MDFVFSRIIPCLFQGCQLHTYPTSWRQASFGTFKEDTHRVMRFSSVRAQNPRKSPGFALLLNIHAVFNALIKIMTFYIYLSSSCGPVQQPYKTSLLLFPPPRATVALAVAQDGNPSVLLVKTQRMDPSTGWQLPNSASSCNRTYSSFFPS
jgi:hypothetical protein